VLATVPAAAVGYVAQDTVERRLGGPRTTAAIGAVAGIALWRADHNPQDRPLTTRTAGMAGVAQVAALAPGVSRAGASMTALRSRRVPRGEAARFSLLMSLPITVGGAALTAVRSKALPPVVPVVVAGVTSAALARRLSSGSRGVIALSALYRLGVAWAVARRELERR
jgi:undecaprenyl pyrophosphate phosphatase UppP